MRTKATTEMRKPMPRRLRAVLAILAFSAPPVFAHSPGVHRSAATLMAVEREWLGAIGSHDVATLARILGREFIDSDYQGHSITRAQYLAYFSTPLSHPAPRRQQSFDDTKVRFVAGGNVAIVTGVVITRSAGASKPETSSRPDAIRHSRFTDVFVLRDGRWQAVAGQETHFTPGAG